MFEKSKQFNESIPAIRLLKAISHNGKKFTNKSYF